MRVALVLLLAAMTLSGCFAPETISSEKRYGVISDTLDRVEDGGSLYDIRVNLSEGPVLVMFSHYACPGCHEWVDELKPHHEQWMSQSNPLQTVMIGVYPPYDDYESLMDAFGDSSSDNYAPWPVIVTTTSTNAWDLGEDKDSGITLFDAFGTPSSPKLFLISQSGVVVWESDSYNPKDNSIADINEKYKEL